MLWPHFFIFCHVSHFMYHIMSCSMSFHVMGGLLVSYHIMIAHYLHIFIFIIDFLPMLTQHFCNFFIFITLCWLYIVYSSLLVYYILLASFVYLFYIVYIDYFMYYILLDLYFTCFGWAAGCCPAKEPSQLLAGGGFLHPALFRLIMSTRNLLIQVRNAI